MQVEVLRVTIGNEEVIGTVTFEDLEREVSELARLIRS
jgi:hypothetical protein